MNWFRHGRMADRAVPRRPWISPDFVARADGEAGPCKICAESRHGVHHENGSFWVICEACGARGPKEASSYEALMSWRRLAGLRAPDMTAQLGSICLVLVALAAILGMIGFVLG